MSTIEMKEKYKCNGECNTFAGYLGTCKGHTVELRYQDTADVLIISRDGEYVDIDGEHGCRALLNLLSQLYLFDKDFERLYEKEK